MGMKQTTLDSVNRDSLICVAYFKVCIQIPCYEVD